MPLLDPIDRQIRRIERCGSANEETIQFAAAKADVGQQLRNIDLDVQSSVWIIAMNPVTGAGPDAAAAIEAETVEEACGAIGKDAIDCPSPLKRQGMFLKTKPRAGSGGVHRLGVLEPRGSRDGRWR